MIVVLMGHSGSGKSTIEKELSSRGLEKIVNYTTRPIRDYEIDGIDYHFVTETEYSFLEAEGIFAEQNVFNNWKYGLSLKGVDYDSRDYVIVLTPKGCRELIDLIGREHIKIIFLNVSEGVRKQRLLDRGDDLGEITRRAKADQKDFANLPFRVDFTFVNHKIADAVEGILYRVVYK